MMDEHAMPARDGFAVTRSSCSSEQTVVAGWAIPEVKRRWFAEAEGFMDITYELDFRVGGFETCVGRHAGGRRLARVVGPVGG